MSRRLYCTACASASDVLPIESTEKFEILQCLQCKHSFILGGALENWPNFQTPLLLMKLWDLLDNMCVVVDLKFEQKIPSGSASSSSKTR